MEDSSAPAAPVVTPEPQFRKSDYESRFLPDLPGNSSRWIVKITIVIAALLIFQIPLSMIRNLSSERNSNAGKVQQNIAESWGGDQVVEMVSPVKTLNITSEITPEVRYRGIYSMTIYNAGINLDVTTGNPGEKLVLKISDIKGVKSISASAGNQSLPVTFEKNNIIVSPVGSTECNISLKLRGSRKLKFIPKAETSQVFISGKWDSPGFSGTALPEERTITADNFSARWNFMHLIPGNTPEAEVELCISAGPYQQLERLMEYATYFLIIFFFTLLISEFITRIAIHPLQYVIAAGAPVLFYLMVLAFGEQIGFGCGYAVSAAVVVAMVSVYVRMFLGRFLPALLSGIIFALSYFVNYIILGMEKLSLLAGTIILAIILGVLMAVTGKINQRTE